MISEVNMSSITITLTGRSSTLTAYFYPEIELDKQFNYSCALLDFYTYNSIPNVHRKNNQFHYWIGSENEVKRNKILSIPPGCYELDEIGSFLRENLAKDNIDFKLITNRNTFSCSIESTNNVQMDFTRPGSIGSVLGFDKYLAGDTIYESNQNVNIQNINSIRVDCDLTTGSFHNGESTHTIFEFSPSVRPGYKMNIQPKNLIYLPITRHRINSITITIVNQNGQLIDFRGEEITCRIHIKKDL